MKKCINKCLYRFKQHILRLVQHAGEDKNTDNEAEVHTHKKKFKVDLYRRGFFTSAFYLNYPSTTLCLSACHVISNSSGRRRKWLSINVCERREQLRLTFGPYCRIQAGVKKLPEERLTPDKTCNWFHGFKLILQYSILLPLYQSYDFTPITTSQSIYRGVSGAM